MARLPLSPRTTSSINSSASTTFYLDNRNNNKTIKPASSPRASSSHLHQQERHQHYGHHSNSLFSPMPTSPSPKQQLHMARYKRYAPPLSPTYKNNSSSSSSSSPRHHFTINHKNNESTTTSSSTVSESASAVTAGAAKDTHHHNDRLASPSMPVSGHVKSIRSTIEKKAAVGTVEKAKNKTITCVNNENEGRISNTTWKESILISQRAQQEQEQEHQQRFRQIQMQTNSTSICSSSSSSSSSIGSKNRPIPPQSPKYHRHHRFVPNRDSPTWKSVEQQSLFMKKGEPSEMVSLSPQKTNELQQQQQQHSPTPTVSSTAAVASTTSSNDDAILSDADRISATILVAGNDDDDVKEVLLPRLKNEDVALSVRQRIALAMDEIEKEDNEEKHLNSLPSPPSSSPPTPSPSSACSSVNWEVLEKLLGGGGDGSINGDDGCESVNDDEGRRTEDGRKDAKSKIRLLAELVGSKALTTCTSDEGVAKRDEKEKSKNMTNRVTKLPRRSKEGTTSKQGQTKELRPNSLLGSFVERNDMATMTSPKSMDIVVIETAPSSITTTSSSKKSNTIQQRQTKGNVSSNIVRNNNSIAVETATSFSSASSYSSSSLVYSLGDTILSLEQQQQQQQQQQQPQQHRAHPSLLQNREHPTLANNYGTTATSVDIAVDSSMDGSSMQHRVPTSHSVTDQQKGYVSIDVPAPFLKYDVNSTNTNTKSNHDTSVESDPVADVLASTLAECRLLLEMSPPPTPIMYHQGEPHKVPIMEEKKEKYNDSSAQNDMELPQLSATSKILTSANLFMQSLKSQTQQSEETGHIMGEDYDKDEDEGITGNYDEHAREDGHEEKNEKSEEIEAKVQEDAEVTAKEEERLFTSDDAVIGDGNSLSKASYRSSTSFAEFLTCPACSEQFTAEDEGAHQPLHSFACDHIICRGCVYNAFSHAGDGGNSKSLSTMVFCPECGQDGAFDIYRPIVSRAYLNLVRKLISTGQSISSKDGECSYSNQGAADLMSRSNDEQRQQSQKIGGGGGGGGGEGKSVPSQICVPSPTSKKNRFNNHLKDESPAKEHDEIHRKRDSTQSVLTVIVPTTNTLIDRNDTKREEMFATDMTDHHQDPNTPISRAQFHVVQRREKLAQSLEKVNMILERSKALTVPETPKEVNFMAIGNDFSSNLIDDNGFVRQSFEWDKNVFQTVTSGVKSRCKSKLRVDTGGDAFLSSSSWSSPPSFGQVEVIEDNAPEENCNTFTTDEPLVLIDHISLSFPPKQSSQVTEPAEGGTNAMDIFREVEIDQVDIVNNQDTSELIEFGCTSNLFSRSASTESPTTESKDETLLLLPAENRMKIQPSSANKQGTMKVLKSSKFKAYCFNSIMKNSADVAASASSDQGSFDDDTEQEKTCPQFLPSLNYSIMHESDEFAGLVAVETPRGAKTKHFAILSGSGAKGKRRMQKGKKFGSSGGAGSSSSHSSNNNVAPKPSQQLVSWSFDDDFFHQMVDVQNQENSGSIHDTQQLRDVEAMVVAVEEDKGGGENQEAVSAINPTYDFSMHSCSLSPSTHTCDDDDDENENDENYGPRFQLNGRSLVTHKPRQLHKKILNTFRVVGNGNSAVKKSRKV